MVSFGPKAWDIWWAKWPDEGGGEKNRFVLVLGKVEGDYLCVYVSSQLKEHLPHVTVPESAPDFVHTGLKTTSHVYPRDHRPLTHSDLLYRAGFLSAAWREEVGKAWRGEA